MNAILKFLATGAYISYIPTAVLKGKKNTGAGFLGTLEAFILVVFFMPSNYAVYALVLAAFTVAAVYISDKVNFGDGQKDNPKIIIDEIVGYFFAMLFLPKTAETLLLAFILFRVFDSSKILFIKRLESLDFKSFGKAFPAAGFAVVLDDIAAGVYANIIIQLLIVFNLIKV